MTEHYRCTYCGDDLGSMDDHAPGETLHCGTCDVDFRLERESAVRDLVVFVCPYCGHENKREQGVTSVRCENNERHPDPDVSGDCGLVFDPAGAETRPAQPDEERVQMVPVTGGEN